MVLFQTFPLRQKLQGFQPTLARLYIVVLAVAAIGDDEVLQQADPVDAAGQLLDGGAARSCGGRCCGRGARPTAGSAVPVVLMLLAYPCL